MNIYRLRSGLLLCTAILLASCGGKKATTAVLQNEVTDASETRIIRPLALLTDDAALLYRGDADTTSAGGKGSTWTETVARQGDAFRADLVTRRGSPSSSEQGSDGNSTGFRGAVSNYVLPAGTSGNDAGATAKSSSTSSPSSRASTGDDPLCGRGTAFGNGLVNGAIPLRICMPKAPGNSRFADILNNL